MGQIPRPASKAVAAAGISAGLEQVVPGIH